MPDKASIPTMDTNPMGCRVRNSDKIAPISPKGPVMPAITISGILSSSNIRIIRIRKIMIGTGAARYCTDFSLFSIAPPFSRV